MKEKVTVATENATKNYDNDLERIKKRGQQMIEIGTSHNKSEPSLQSEATTLSIVSETTESTKRTSSKQHKASLEEYKELFLTTPKIVDRQPVFISRDLRDRIDEIARRLGERRMSVSGFLENLTRQHLDSYNEDIERWKRL